MKPKLILARAIQCYYVGIMVGLILVCIAVLCFGIYQNFRDICNFIHKYYKAAIVWSTAIAFLLSLLQAKEICEWAEKVIKNKGEDDCGK